MPPQITDREVICGGVFFLFPLFCLSCGRPAGYVHTPRQKSASGCNISGSAFCLLVWMYLNCLLSGRLHFPYRSVKRTMTAAVSAYDAPPMVDSMLTTGRYERNREKIRFVFTAASLRMGVIRKRGMRALCVKLHEFTHSYYNLYSRRLQEGKVNSDDYYYG